MAFYRCDRGLGFDTSNSTGTNKDVLEYKINGSDGTGAAIGASFIGKDSNRYKSGSIHDGMYKFHNVDVSNFETMLKFQILNNYTYSTTDYYSLILSSNKYLLNGIRIPATDFDSDNYKNTIYGKPGNSNLKFINRKYKEILKISPIYTTGQLYFEKNCLLFMPSNNDRDFVGVDKKYLNNIIHKSYDISYDNELIKNLYNIAKSENNNTACIELSNINTADIGKIFSYSELRYIMNSFFVYKAQNNDIYLYYYYYSNANDITNTKLLLRFNSNYSDSYPGIYSAFSNKKLYLHEPYIKITNDGKIEHLPIISTTPNSNVIFSQAYNTSFQSLCAISDDGIYNIYSSLTGLYFRKYSLDYKIISEIKINTDQFYFTKEDSDCLDINRVMYCYDNNIIIDTGQWTPNGRNIASIDYDGNLISVLSFHYNKTTEINTRCLRVLPRKDYIGIFTSDYTYYSYNSDMRIHTNSYNDIVDNSLLTIYNEYEDLKFLNYIELNPYNLDIMHRTEYDRYCIPYNTKFGVRSYLGINRVKNNEFIYDKYPLCSYNKMPIIFSVYNFSTPYLVNIRDDRSMIISYDDDNYVISIYDTLYLLNDYDTNYNGYNIDNSNTNYTDYYFN